MRVFALVERLAAPEPIDRLAVEETLHFALASQEDRGGVSPRDRATAEAIAYAVDLRFDEHLTLDELAEIAGISVFHACRAFRRVRNTSIHRYQQTVRLRHALALLRDTSRPLAQVAVDTGFANQGHLGNAFHRRFGVTPARARRMPAAHLANALRENL
jgi:AraC family transcriptional regulator